MSLFKAREWWSTIVGEEEEFDSDCLCLANIDNHASGTDKVIVGSFHGFLRIYNPRPCKRDDGGWSGFRPEDVLVETQLQHPILQVEAGIFIAGSDKLHLAVLHPRKIAVYTVIGTTGSVEHGSHHQLKLAYEHNLGRTTFNFCYGQFGGVKGRDFICVQSMDGTVSVYEQETFAFSRFLPGALLPGPLRYVPKTDSFVTVSSSRQVESYKYQVLAVATDVKSKEESQNIKSGKRVGHDWTFNIGEQALDIYVTDFNNAPPSIYILGERNLYCLTEVGKLRFMKKYDYNPSCFVPFTSVSEGTINCIVGTHTKTLMIYQDITLKWAAQLTRPPVQVAVANFQDLNGVVVTLGEEGHLECSYLGTEPALFSPPTADLREINYEAQDQEMAQLQKQIKAQQHKGLPMPNAKSDDDVTLMTSVSSNLDEMSQARESEVEDEDPIPSLSVKIQVKAKMSVNNVQLHVHVAPPLAASESLITFPTVDSGRPAEAQISFFIKQQMAPSDLNADITATYTTISGAPRVVHSVVKLPLKLVMKPVLPVKNANFKITVDTNKPPVNLNDLFPDMLGENAGGQGNALGFQTYGGPVVTVLASKTSQRYRLQCDIFEGMWLVLNELVQRLQSYHTSRRISDFTVTYEGQLPLQEYFDVLDRHFDFRQTDEKYKKLLEERAVQFRAIQRRLLTRFKDKTPAPLSNLDTLLDGTYRQILHLADAAAENSRSERSAASDLSCATRLLTTLVRYWAHMSEAEFRALQAAVSPTVSDNGEQGENDIVVGWEECVDAAITHLLRTCLAKSSKDQTVNPQPLVQLKDTTKLKKHIALLCDRLSKGAKLSIEGQDNNIVPDHPSEVPKPSASRRQNNKSAAQPKAQIAPGLSESDRDLAPMSNGDHRQDEMPIGSKLGENKSPRKKHPPAMNGDLHGSGRGLDPVRGGRDLEPLTGAPAGGRLAPLGGAGALPPLGGDPRLPPMGDDEDVGGGHKFLKKKSSAQSRVPDLDDMETAPDDDSLLYSGSGNEMIFGV